MSGKYDLLASMNPFLGGGEMIADVFLDYSTYAPPPLRFEAGKLYLVGYLSCLSPIK